MRLAGLLLILIAFVVPIPWFLHLATQYSSAAVFSQYLGVLALVAMGIGQILAARLPGAEVLFGGLDRIYVLHKWLAVFALVCLGLHDVIDAEIDGLGRETMLMDIAEDVGEVVLYGLLILVFVTVTTFIPYTYWRWSHQFIGVFYALGVFHFVFIQKPFDNLDPLSLYVLVFCAAGILSYLYMVLLYARLPGPARYRVSNIVSYNGAAEISLQPVGKGIRHRAGQFAFFGFDLAGLSEIHPFTISVGPTPERELKVCVKALGGYTDALIRALREGTPVRVFGSYGRFRQPKKTTSQIWIAAGIGITPFMAWARALDAQKSNPIHLYYLLRSDADAPFVDELNAISATHPDFRLTVRYSNTQGRMSAAEILKDHRDHIKSATASYCGPVELRKQLKAELTQAGLKKSRFHFEEFEIRSGIGLMVVVDWAMKRFGRKFVSH